MFRIWTGWKLTPEFQIFKTPSQALPFVSVVVACRNEEKNILFLLEDLDRQSYDKQLFEVILVDDQSEDKTYEAIATKVKKLSVSTILEQNISPQTGKKAALRKAVGLAKGELVMQTDADCRVTKNWIREMAHYFISYNPAMILGPVILKNGLNFLTSFQKLENLALMGTTCGSAYYNKPLLANGANMAYEKKQFELLNDPYNSSLASGDDIFLMQTIHQKNPDKIHFLKSHDAVVTTLAENKMATWWAQRKRWIKKSRHYSLSYLKNHALLIFAANVSLVMTFVIALLTNQWWFFIGNFTLKILIDTILLQSVKNFFRSKIPPGFILLSNFIYPFYTLIVAVFSNLGSIQWKNRTIREN